MRYMPTASESEFDGDDNVDFGSYYNYDDSVDNAADFITAINGLQATLSSVRADHNMASLDVYVKYNQNGSMRVLKCLSCACTGTS